MTARTAASTTSPLTLDGHPGTVTVARDATGRPVLVDLRLGSHGTTLHGLSDALSTALTLALAHGAPADLLAVPVPDSARVPAPRHPHHVPGPYAAALHTALAAHLG